MSLDLSKLQNIQERPDGKIIARCPACAENGGDATGNHLIVFPDGKYGCVATPNDKGHNKMIYSLCGARTVGGEYVPKPISIARADTAVGGRRVLGRL